jgi:hypothetical protein
MGHVTGGKGGEGEGSIKAIYGGKRLLTVGDGDLTFSLSLAQQLACTSGIHELEEFTVSLAQPLAKRRSTLPMSFILLFKQG